MCSKFYKKKGVLKGTPYQEREMCKCRYGRYKIGRVVTILYHNIFLTFFLESVYKCCRINVYRDFMFSNILTLKPNLYRYYRYKLKESYLALLRSVVCSILIFLAQDLQYLAGALFSTLTKSPHS